MPNLRVTEIKAFLPARDFELSKRFYQDLGFTMASEGGGVAYFHHEHVSFLLQDFCVDEHNRNLMMHLLVESVEDWHQKITESGLADKYKIEVGEIELQPWRMRDFSLFDPSGVLWIIAQNVE
jgi:catechol 2,3-dioxygenase-like lactoylglutathione lyase family enzyme